MRLLGAPGSSFGTTNRWRHVAAQLLLFTIIASGILKSYNQQFGL